MPEISSAHPPRDPALRVGISTISFRHRPLEEALSIIGGIGAREVDLGAIPAVVDHVPVPFRDDPSVYVRSLAKFVLRAGAVNADVGNLNDPTLTEEALRTVAEPLADLAAAVGGSLIVPCGRASWEPFVDEDTDLATISGNLTFLQEICSDRGVRLQVELLHHLRFIHAVERAQRLLATTGPETFGLLFDVSHVVASREDPVTWLHNCADRVERVHLRDAIPGNLNLGIGRGEVDFPAVVETLERSGYRGNYILELETHDVTEEEREADAARSFHEITALLERNTPHQSLHRATA